MTAASTTSTDRIEKQIQLKAPRQRVWRALTDAGQFGTWFGARIEGGAFEPGHTLQGYVTIKGYEHLKFDMVIERIEPETLFSYQWHPYPKDPDADYSKETMTLVVFTLEPAQGGTLLRVVESGFDQIPAHRRAEAFRANEGGWAGQMKNIAQYLGEPK